MARKQKASRARQRKSQADAAARVCVPQEADVCIIGGGAAGLVAAITAAEAGARTVVLERDLACGRTILATGNGRCNFANTQLDPGRYNDPAFVAAVCGPPWLSDILAFFADCGLAWEEEGEGRLYPLSRQAASVRNVLLGRAQRAGAVMAAGREAVGIAHESDAWHVSYRNLFGPEEGHILHARRVVMASGGGATALCEPLGLMASPSLPVLCPLACQGPLLDRLDGRRVRAQAMLTREGHMVADEEGEVLFRDYGLSGIVIFNLSRYAQPGDTLELDLLPHLTEQAAVDRARHTLDGLLDPLVAQALIADTDDIKQALERAKQLTVRVLGPAEAHHAQVTRGGLVTTQFDPATLGAKDVPGLFACGEALDVDGPCGGFNLAWAWKSGLVAGAGASRP